MRILVGYDGSEAASRALDLARERAKALGAEVVHVLHSKVTDLLQKEHDQDRRELANIEKKLREEGVACQAHLLVQNMEPGEHLVAFAKENGIDEIVIGVRLRSRVGKFIMGSTAQYVILKAPCPVLTIK